MAGENIDSGTFLGLVSDTVTDKLANFQVLSDKYGAALNAALSDIGKIEIDAVAEPVRLNVPPEVAPSVDVSPLPAYNPAVLDVPDAPSLPNVDALLGSLNTDGVDFDLPNSPTVSLPDAPELRDIALPDAPDADLSCLVPKLCDLDIQGELKGLLAFDGNPPRVDFDLNVSPFDWVEPEYHSELLDGLTAKVKTMLQGGTGLPPEIEAALFDRAREREANSHLVEMQQITDQWAARGFSLPGGVLDKQLDAAREQNRLKLAELNRDILTQAATWEMENLRFAVQQGLALEQMTVNLFLNAANRLFEVARYRVESEISVFNARVALFNAVVQAWAQRLDFQKTKLQVLNAFVGMVGQVFDVYRTRIQAYAEQISAEKVKFDAYSARLNGEETKVKAYAALVSALGGKADVYIRQNQLKLNAAEAKIKAYDTQLSGFKAQLDASLKQAEYETQTYAARVDAFKAENSAAVAQAEMQSRFADMNVRTNIAYAQMQISEYEAKMRNAMQKAQIALESAKALGQYTAQLAAGAMSAQHVSASMSASTSYGHSKSESESTSHSYSY